MDKVKITRELANVLTEEELRGIDVNNDSNTYEATVIEKLINSHRQLLSANAELSFKNQKYKETIEILVENMNQIKALEEAK